MYEDLKFESSLLNQQKETEFELLLSCFYEVVAKFKAFEQLSAKQKNLTGKTAKKAVK